MIRISRNNIFKIDKTFCFILFFFLIVFSSFLFFLRLRQRHFLSTIIILAFRDSYN